MVVKTITIMDIRILMDLKYLNIKLIDKNY